MTLQLPIQLYLAISISVFCHFSWATKHNPLADKICKTALETPENVEAAVFALRDHELIPPTWLHKSSPYSSQEIARALVKRLHIKETEWRKTNSIGGEQSKEIDLQKDTEILLFFSPADILFISQNGFLNFHQTNTTKGSSRSKSLDDQFLGIVIPREARGDELRSKSAYLNVRLNIDIGAGHLELHKQYGPIAAKMKNHVKNQSLIVNDDSLAISEYFKFPDIFRHATTFYSHHLPLASIALHDYIEVLIFGKIDLSDVEYFLVLDNSLNANQMKTLKNTGKLIYKMNVTRRQNRFVYHK